MAKTDEGKIPVAPAMKGDASEGFGRMLAAVGLLVQVSSAHPNTKFHSRMMRTAGVLGSLYAASIVYIGASYTDSWLEKLRLLPLLILAVTIPLSAAILIQKKHLMELSS